MTNMYPEGVDHVSLYVFPYKFAVCVLCLLISSIYVCLLISTIYQVYHGHCCLKMHLMHLIRQSVFTAWSCGIRVSPLGAVGGGRVRKELISSVSGFRYSCYCLCCSSKQIYSLKSCCLGLSNSKRLSKVFVLGSCVSVVIWFSADQVRRWIGIAKKVWYPTHGASPTHH